MQAMKRMSDLEACFGSRDGLESQFTGYVEWMRETGIEDERTLALSDKDCRMLTREWAFDWAHQRGHAYPGILADMIEVAAIRAGWIR